MCNKSLPQVMGRYDIACLKSLPKKFDVSMCKLLLFPMLNSFLDFFVAPCKIHRFGAHVASRTWAPGQCSRGV